MNRTALVTTLACASCGVATALPAFAAGAPIDYTISGTPFKGYVTKPAGTSKGLVIVIHDWDGLTAYEEKRADMLADMGYTAVAIDLYGAGNRPVETAAKKAETGKLYGDRELMRSRILGGIAEARKIIDQQAVVVGYCFGGAATLELARSGEADRVVGYASFHGGLSTPDGQSYSAQSGPLFVAHGGADTSITNADAAALADQLEQAGATYTLSIYSGAPHAFTVFGSDRYQTRADTQSWAELTTFMSDNFAPAKE